MSKSMQILKKNPKKIEHLSYTYNMPRVSYDDRRDDGKLPLGSLWRPNLLKNSDQKKKLSELTQTRVEIKNKLEWIFTKISSISPTDAFDCNLRSLF